LTRGGDSYFDKFDDYDRFDKSDKLVSRRLADANGRCSPFFQKEATPKPCLSSPGIVRTPEEMRLGQEAEKTSTAKTARSVTPFVRRSFAAGGCLLPLTGACLGRCVPGTAHLPGVPS
jgi:hypothetical protein